MNAFTNSNNFKMSRELLIEVNDTGMITLISPNCYDILGFTQDELLNTYIDNHLGYSFDNLLLNTKVQTSISKKDGEKLSFDTVVSPLINDDSKIVGVQLSLINISKYIHIEEEYNEFIKIFEKAKDIVFKFQIIPECKFTYISPSVYDILGYDAEAHYANPFISFQIIHPEDVEVQQSKVDKNSDFSKTFCARLKHKDGHYVWIEDHLMPIYDEDGNLTSISGISRDITKRKKMEEKLEEQKKELEAIIENISDGISIIDNKGKYILVNKSAREMFLPAYKDMNKAGNGYKQYELYDIHGEETSLENIPSSRLISGETFKDIRTTVKFANKTLQVDFSGTPIYDSEGNFSLGVLCSRDMTERFEYEKKLKSRNEFLDRLIDNLELPVVRLSCPDLEILEINQKGFYMVKTIMPNIESAMQIKGNKVTDIIKNFNESEYFHKIDEVIKEKKIKYINKKVYVANGNEVYSNFIFEPLFEQNGEIKEILVLVVDVTDEVKSNIVMEKELKSQGEFLANISHELKTPLNVIFSAVQLFSLYCNSGSLDEKKDLFIKYIESIKQNSYRLSKLINNIVDSSKIEAGFFELDLSNNNIVEVVEETVMSVTNFTEIKGLNIIFDTDIEEKVIACDPVKIERIVLNLISNAIKFSTKGEEIFVEIKDKTEFVEISVKDNGVGIEKKHLNTIFDRFMQVDKSLSRNAEGTGIGLSLVKSIVELHGGSISVKSEYGKGSKFVVLLPSKEVMQQNLLFTKNMRNRNESLQVELSDVYS